MHTGLEVLLSEGLPEMTGKRVGLVTNHTGVDSRFRSTADLLHASDQFRLVALFGPEHGVRGEAQAGVEVGASVDGRTGLLVYSLYGETRRPTPAMLERMDALLFDIQDVGVRYATYISTMSLVQEACAEAGIPLVLLDRPNPISGVHIEGPSLNPAFASFVGAHPIPVRHGLTCGELARLFAAERGWPTPTVVPMQGWRRDQWYDETGLPWVQPTPNLPTLDSLTLYPGMCLIEGTNVSEGRGTTRPFELVGAPWLDPFELAAELERRTLPGSAFRPAYFTPTYSKHAGFSCRGVQAYITDRSEARPVELGVHMLHAIRELAPEEFAWRSGHDGSFFVDLLYGSDKLRRMLDGGAGVAEITADWREETSGFRERRDPFLLY